MFKRTGNFLLLFAVIAFYPADARPANIADPLRPPIYFQSDAKSSNKSPVWDVSAILISNNRRLAFVNQRLLGVGDRIDGAQVRAIHGNGVELSVGGRSLLVKPSTTMLRRKTQ